MELSTALIVLLVVTILLVVMVAFACTFKRQQRSLSAPRLSSRITDAARRMMRRGTLSATGAFEQRRGFGRLDDEDEAWDSRVGHDAHDDDDGGLEPHPHYEAELDELDVDAVRGRMRAVSPRPIGPEGHSPYQQHQPEPGQRPMYEQDL